MNEQHEFSRQENEKEELWYKTLRTLDTVGDRLGYPIDPGIKETVAAFLVNNFPTYGSCEGHLEERFGKMKKLRPYVAVGLEEPSQRFVGEAEIKDRIAAQFGINAADIEENQGAARSFWHYIHDNDISETPEFLTVRAKNEELERQVTKILSDFYEERQVNPASKLVVQGIGPAGHFKVTTATENPEVVNEADLPRLNQELVAEQEEVRAFTKYLKEKFEH